jgi:UDP-glucose:(heptosyl)LPS alpha-1,3-glucosyltransferase
VITSRYNGAGELITPGVEGSVVDPQDVQALSDAIRWFLDEGRRQEAGRNARRLAQTRGMQRSVQEVMRVYDLALARKPRKPPP